MGERLDNNAHPLAQTFPVGSLVRVTEDADALAMRLMRDCEMPRAEAIGTAKILREENSKVIGIHDLTDDSGQQHPYISIMTRDGLPYVFGSELVSPAEQ